ncbi:hypothetical protein IKF92_03375 [Candidatus Saccharibacteria bacterium]|nr:hypothetical protein [Candidatus Saccharibacteria bacterium]
MEGNQNGAGTGGTVDFGANGNNTVGTGSVSNANNVAGTMGNAPVGNSPFNSGMMNTPIASGSSDVVLNSGEKKSKKWLVIGGIIGVLVIVIVVFAMMSRGGGFGGRATDLRSSFNIYANYFLSGEAKNDDLPDEFSGEVVVDEETGEEWEYSSFFEKYLAGETDAGEDYMSSLKKYFSTFYDYYMNEMKRYPSAVDYLNDYKSDFDLILAYYSGEDLGFRTLAMKYVDGGKEGVESYIDEVVAGYQDLDNGDFNSALTNYAKKELEMIVWYDEVGCMNGSEINTECSSNNEEGEVLEDEMAWFNNELRVLINDAESNINAGIFELKNIVYGDASEYTEDEKEEMEKNG